MAGKDIPSDHLLGALISSLTPLFPTYLDSSHEGRHEGTQSSLWKLLAALTLRKFFHRLSVCSLWHLCFSFIYSFNKYLLSASYTPGTVISSGETMVNGSQQAPFMGLVI